MKKHIILTSIVLVFVLQLVAQNNVVQGVIKRVGATEEGDYLILETDSKQEITFINLWNLKFQGKDVIMFDQSRVRPDTTGENMAGSMDEAYYLNPDLVDKKVKITYKFVKGTKLEHDPLEEDFNEIVKIELINNNSSVSSNWMVILGSFKTEREAIVAQKNFLTKNSIQTEVLNSNNYQNLTKNLFIIVIAKDLSNEAAKQALQNVKVKGVEGYIKEAIVSK